MWRVVAWGTALVAELLLSGCITDYGPVVVEPEQARAAVNGAPAGAAPRVQRGDKIRVTVYGEENLTGNYDVDPGGNLSLPLAGTIRAAGRTKVELEREITRKFKSDYLQDPKVTVDVASFRPFYIFGEVERPSEYPYRSGMNLLNALTI